MKLALQSFYVLIFLFSLITKSNAIPLDYTFSAVFPSENYYDGNGTLASDGIIPGSRFEVTFRINTDNKYGEYNNEPFSGYFSKAKYVRGSLSNKYIGKQSELNDIVLEDGPASFIYARYLELYDISHGFEEWVIGHSIAAHYEYDDNTRFDFYQDLTLTAITRVPEPSAIVLFVFSIISILLFRRIRRNLHLSNQYSNLNKL